MKKKMISLLLVLALMVSVYPSAYAVNKSENMATADTELDFLDLAISASYVLNSSDATANFVSESTAMQTFPLYNADGSVAAYYVTFTGGGYAVINNNIDNPTAIEFGAERQPLIEEILVKSDDAHIVYCSPVEVYNATLETQETRTVQLNGLHENYPELLSKNEALADDHFERRKLIEGQLVSVTDLNDDYGFIQWSAMPSGAYTADNLPFYDTKWATTGEYDTIANNHCGAVAVTNLAFYFADAGYSNLRKSTDRETFIAVHKYVGNGPVMTIANKARSYFADCGYSLGYNPVGSMTDITSAIKLDHPCGLLLADSLGSWHWVLGVGYRTYNISGDSYIRIVNGWQSDANRFYLMNKGSTFISGSQYYMTH